MSSIYMYMYEQKLAVHDHMNVFEWESGWGGCLNVVQRSVWEYFTHIKTSPLRWRTVKFRPILWTFWAERELYRALPFVIRDLGFLAASYGGPPLFSDCGSINSHPVLNRSFSVCVKRAKIVVWTFKAVSRSRRIICKSTSNWCHYET